MGPPLDSGADYNHNKLGDGVQEVVSSIQDPHLLWLLEGKEDQEAWLVEGELLSCVHYFLQACDPGPLCFQKKEVVLHDLGRSLEYQELQKLEMVDAAEIQHEEEIASYRHSSAERCHGTVEFDAFLDAQHLQ